jgi:hypothetical protein
MAAWNDIKELRLRICDPYGVIDLQAVASAADLPAMPTKQTAYLKKDSGEYTAYDEELGTWGYVSLELSDERLANLVDLYGVARAAPKAIRLILASIGRQMGIVRAGHGAETVQYQTLSDTYGYYKALADSMDVEAAKDSGASTGRYVRTRSPRIGGGM